MHGERSSDDEAPKRKSVGEFSLEQTADGLKYVAPTAALQKIGDKFIGNVTLVGVMVSPFLPATGLTVTSRAPLVGKGMMELAASNARVMEAVQRFNAMFTGGELAAAAASITVALAVDTRLMDKDGRVPKILIPDVVSQLPEPDDDGDSA